MTKKRLGFTLVELLVVIAIIGTLVGLLLPAVQAAREAARRNTCLNNTHQIGLAMQNYANEKGAFPGYIMPFPGSQSTANNQLGVPSSWLVNILPSLDRMDIYDYWKTTTKLNPPVAPNNIKPLLEIGVCPNNRPADTTTGQWLGYRVNTGWSGYIITGTSTTLSPADADKGRTGPQVVAEGVCSDQYNKPTNRPIYRVGLSNIKDGAATTLLLAERSASAEATGLASPWLTQSTPTLFKSADDAEKLGFNWAGMNNIDTATDQTNLTLKFNSNHPSLVVVGFCDGHSRTLRADIDRLVYMQLMAPYDREAGGDYDGTNMGIKDLDKASPVPPLDENKIE